MTVYTCKFVLSSDLMRDLPEEFQVHFSERLGRKITWSDANRTMCDFHVMQDALDEVEYDCDDARSILESRMTEAMDAGATYIDLEN